MASAIENYAPAYQEVKAAHTGNKKAGYPIAHIGSGNKGSKDILPLAKELKLDPAKKSITYRLHQRNYLENGQSGKAIVLNQRLYANTTFYKEVAESFKNLNADVEVANKSFIQMVNKTNTFPYLSSNKQVMEARLTYQEKMEAFTARAVMICGMGKTDVDIKDRAEFHLELSEDNLSEFKIHAGPFVKKHWAELSKEMQDKFKEKLQ